MLAPTPIAVPISAYDGMTMPLIARPMLSSQSVEKEPRKRRTTIVFWL
jgi:hypothetical protein